MGEEFRATRAIADDGAAYFWVPPQWKHSGRLQQLQAGTSVSSGTSVTSGDEAEVRHFSDFEVAEAPEVVSNSHWKGKKISDPVNSDAPFAPALEHN